MTAQQIFERLWDIYTRQNPHALQIYKLFELHGETVVNDHIAFRTFDDPRVDIDVLARPFLESGYVYMGDYHFVDKHLYAKHFECPGQDDAPRVFISQLISSDFSQHLRDTSRRLVDSIPHPLLESDDLIFSGAAWGAIPFSLYESLRGESEYAAWLSVHGLCANHFTVSVNHLRKLESLQKVNAFLKENGFLLNDSGGEIKGTPEELLEQSSTRSGIVKVQFSEGVYEVPSCYYEFARRYAGKDGKIYSGFIAKSADKIFESTDFYRKK